MVGENDIDPGADEHQQRAAKIGAWGQYAGLPLHEQARVNFALALIGLRPMSVGEYLSLGDVYFRPEADVSTGLFYWMRSVCVSGTTITSTQRMFAKPLNAQQLKEVQSLVSPQSAQSGDPEALERKRQAAFFFGHRNAPGKFSPGV